EDRRDAGDRRGHDEAVLQPGTEVALSPGGSEACQLRVGRPGEAGDQVLLGVERQKEDREHRVDPADREERQHRVGDDPLDTGGAQRSSPRALTSSTIPARVKMAAVRMTAIAAAYPTRLNT